MKTVVELYKDGHKEVFHRTTSGAQAWTHLYGEPCEACPKTAGQRGSVSGVGQGTGQKRREPLTSKVTKADTPADQALWDKSSREGRKAYERARKARKREAYTKWGQRTA